MREPASPFTNALAVYRHTVDGYVALQNDRLRRVTALGVQQENIDGADHLAQVLEDVFSLSVPHPERIWEKVAAIRLVTA